MKNLAWIIYVLDESGSMSTIKDDTIGSFNEFIKEQKKVEGLANCSLIKFNSNIEKVYENLSIEKTPLLDNNTYQPKNMTKLYDAIGHTINDFKNKIKILNENEKPDKILFVILTDGQENSSRDFNKNDILNKITKREKKGWKFLYLGANQDAMKEGGKIGVNKFNTVTWSADSKGVKSAMDAVNTYAVNYRKASTVEDYNSLNLSRDFAESSEKFK